MDHASAGMGSQSEAFYDLLKPTNDSANFFHKGGENPTPEFEFGHDDAHLGMNLRTNSPSVSAPSPPQPNKNMYVSRGGDEPAPGGMWRQPSYETKVYQTHDQPVSREYSSQRQDRESASANAATVAAVDAVMKKYADSIMFLLRSMNDRTSQLESATQRLEYSLQGLKAAVSESFGETNAKIEVLEKLIKEVQTGVLVLQDKQEIIEAQSQLGNMQLNTPDKFSSILPGVEGPPKVVTPGNQAEPVINQPSSAPFHQQQLPSPATMMHHHAPSLPAPTSYQQPQLSSPPLVQPHRENMPLPSAPQQHQLPLFQPQSQHAPQGPPLPQYSQQPNVPPYSSFQHGHNFSGAQQPPQYPKNFSSESSPSFSKYEPLPDRQSPLPPYPPPGSSGLQRYESFSGTSPSMPVPYPPNAYPSHVASYESQPSIASGGYGYKVAQPASGTSGSGGYPRLPTALPTAQPVHTSSNPGSAGGTSSGNRSTSVDEVIENVAAMGFPREEIRSVVRRLAESGQPVELNVVLDKLKAWYGR